MPKKTPPSSKSKPTKLRPLSEAELAKMDPEDLAAYEEALEAAYWAQGKESLAAYSTMVEVPGTPLYDETGYFPQRLTPDRHHLIMIDVIQKMMDGSWPNVDGAIFMMPPGAAKSTYLSKIAASWIAGRKPRTNVIGASYGQDLANRNGRHARQMARSPEFEKCMGCTVTGDNQAVGQWSLTNGSEFRSAGLTAGITGFRADAALVDDPIKGREDADSELIRDKVSAILTDDVFTRLKPGGKIFIALTRWHEDDPVGRLLGEDWKGQSGAWRGTDGRLWYVVNLPLLAEHEDDLLGRKEGELLWPTWFKMSEAERLRKQARKGGTFARTWSSLYQQRPAPNEGAILAKSYWRRWPEKKDPPECERVYLCYDTAFEEDEEADDSAMTAWGVFKHISKKPTGEEYGSHRHVIMLGAWNEKVSAVDLMKEVKEHCKLFSPDQVIVEKRASGIQLIQELRRRRFPVVPWLPRGKPGTKGKVPRAHAVAAILEGGSVWYVPGKRTEKVLDQCAAFPYGTNDDLVDTVTMSLAYFRDRWIFQMASDELDKEEREELAIERARTRSLERPHKLYNGPGSSNRADRYEIDEDFSLMDERPEPRRRRGYG